MKRALASFADGLCWFCIAFAAAFWIVQLALAYWSGAIERLIR